MASKTDLAGYLRNDEGAVLGQMEDWFRDGDPKNPGQPPKLPAVVRVLYRAPGAQSEEQLINLPIQTLPSSASPLVDKIESEIIRKLGATPIGRFRIRGWGDGCAADPGLDVTRTLSVVEDSADVALLRQRNAELTREAAHYRDLNAQLTISANTTTVGLANALATASSMRAVGSSAGDMGGLSGLLGLLGLIIFKPHLQAVMNGEDGPLKNLGDRMLQFLMPMPSGVRTTAADEQLVRELLADPEKREKVIAQIEQHVPGARALLAVAAEGGQAPAAKEAEPPAIPVSHLLPSRRPPASALKPTAAAA